MELPVDAVLGERIRYYRQQAGLTQKGLADLCGVSESAIRNYELGNRVPDFLTLKGIAEQLRVSYYAIADVDLLNLDGAVQALFKLEEIYGLHPVEADGHVHFVFRDSVAIKDFKADLDFVMQRPGFLLQHRAMQFMDVCAQHDAGELTDEEYTLWKSKFPEYQRDFQNAIRADKADREVAVSSDGDPLSATEPQAPERGRKRKINNRRKKKQKI